ncbi:hypothetical protein HYV43_07220 [Candidatus Micrarchaeota archaeon]|nr:hypothetical protein [Candidatus Micrarchaeota archaeon]
MAHLPQLFGVRHSMEHLEAAKRIIDRLPKGSLVGLEMDLPPVHAPLFRKKYPAYHEANKNGTGFFTLLARHAENKGHTVVWMDRPAFSMAGQAEHMDRLEALCRPIIAQGRQPSDREREQYQRLILDFRTAQFVHNPFRSRIMTSQIRARNRKNVPRRWRTSDVVIVGSIHAVQIAENLSTKVREQIGVSAAEAKADSEMAKRQFEQMRSNRRRTAG